MVKVELYTDRTKEGGSWTTQTLDPTNQEDNHQKIVIRYPRIKYRLSVVEGPTSGTNANTS